MIWLTSMKHAAGALEIQGLRLKQEVIDGFDLPFSCISGADSVKLSGWSALRTSSSRVLGSRI